MTSPALIEDDLSEDNQTDPQDWFDRINALFTLPTHQKWEDTLQRPASAGNLDGAGPTHVSRWRTPRNQYLDTIWSYYVGDPPLPNIAEEYRDVFRDVMRKSRSNYAPMCIAAMLDRSELQSVSTVDGTDSDGDNIAGDIMEETGFAAVSKDIFSYTFGLGDGYGMVVPGAAGATELSNGALCPSIHAIDPRRCIGIPDPDNPIRLRAAVVRTIDPIFRVRKSHLFLPGKKWTFNQSAEGAAGWDISTADAEDIEGLDDFGGIPIVRFPNLNGLGEYECHLDLLDRINDVTLQRIIGFWYQALRQRALKGDEDEGDEDSPDETAPVDFNKVFKAGPGALWQIPSDYEIWESQQTDFSGFINGKREDVKEFAAVTSTPLHLITPDAANGSAAGAGLMRESMTAKVRDRRARLTPPLKLLWRMAFALAGAADRGRKMKLNWGPLEFHTLAEQGSASAQAQGTLSVEDRCERIWDMSPDETQSNIQRLRADQILGLSAPPPTSGTVQAAATVNGDSAN